VNAQEADGYRLRTPSAEEYLAALPDIASANTQDDFYLILALYNELMLHYPEFTEMPLGLLYPVAMAFREYYSFSVSGFGDGITQNEWNEWLFTAWLRENPNALEAADMLIFEDFDMSIQRADLSGDGVNELLLTVRETRTESYGEFSNYVGYWVLEQTSEGFRHVTSPLNWYQDTRYLGSSGRGGVVHTLKIEDINNDGLKEWVVLVGGYMLRGFGECHRLRVLGWRGDDLIDLIDDELGYCTNAADLTLDNIAPVAQYTFTNAEIRQQRVRVDSWGCSWTQTDLYEWDGIRYTARQQNRDFEGTFNCGLREAEEAMRLAEFERAVVVFERALLLPDGPLDVEQDDWWRILNFEQRQYAELRLAIAHALTGRMDQALSLIAALRTEEPASILMERLIASVIEVQTPIGFCLAVHDTFVGLRDDFTTRANWRDYSVAFIGEVFEDVIVSIENYPPDPIKAGCDPTLLQDKPITQPTVAPTTMPDSEYSPPDRGDFHCGIMGILFCSLYEANDALALRMIEELTTEDYEREANGEFPSGDLRLAVLYRQASALDALNRPDEALAAYVEIITLAPETPWAKLAALHVEPVE
jgi:hypothetical protein